MDRFDEEIENWCYQCIGAAIEVHRHLGPGHPEIVYENAMAKELTLRGIPFERQKVIPIFYKEEKMGEGRVDFFVAGRLIIELKSVSEIIRRHKGQTGYYLSSIKEPLGLLINFNVVTLKDGGIHRVIQSDLTQYQ